MASFFRLYKFVKASYYPLSVCLFHYSAALIQRPFLAQSATAAFLFGAGDVIAQQAIERQGKNHDVRSHNNLDGNGTNNSTRSCGQLD